MILNVFVREQVLPIQVGDGDQTIKWLSTVACFRYAEAHDFAWDVNQFIPVHVADAKHRTLLPNNKLKDCNLDNFEVHIEVLGPHLGPNDPKTRREKSLWERYAYAAEDEWVKVTFRYDLESENGGSTAVTSAVPDEHTGTDQRSRDLQLQKKLQKRLKAAPELVGNFTGWDNPIRMHPERIENQESQTKYIWEDVFPYGSQLVFKFIVNDVEVCGRGYDVVKDSSGEEVNYLRIRPPAHSYSELQSPRGQARSDNPSVAVDSMLNARPQNFESVRSMTPEMRAQLFESDWKKMQFADKVRTKKERESIKELLREHFEELRMIFQYFSCHGAGDIIHMNMMEFAYFCHTCRIPDKHVTMATIDQVFRRVNIEEEFDEKAIEDNPGNYRNAMKIVPDPYNPDNQFIRGEFMEALIRLAMKKYPVQDACTATQRLLREHVLAYALDASYDDIRKYLLDPAVQRVYRKYSRRLTKLYQKQCRLDPKDPDTTTMSIREFEMLLEEYKLIDENVSRRAALAAFALSQDASTEDTDNYKMVYGEFLEALGRIAFEKYGNKSELSLADKLETLCQILFAS